MAIEKLKVVNGVSGDFWVTQELYISPDRLNSRMTMALYESEAAFVSGGAAIEREDVILQGSDNPFFLKELAKLGEAKLVSMPGEFNGGLIVSGF